MKAKSVYSYLFKDSKTPICIYYTVIISIAVLVIGGVSMVDKNNMITIMFNYRNATMIFLFVFGLNQFKENFGMFLQNGVLRKDVLVGTAKSMVTISIIMSSIDFAIITLLQIIGKWLFANTAVVFKMDLLSTLYPDFANKFGFMGVNIAELVVFAIGYICAMLLGYFITMLYYNLTKMGKVAVSLGAVALCYIVPFIDMVVFKLTLFRGFMKVYNLALGIDVNPYISIIPFTAIGILLFAACYYLINKTKLKAH